MSEKRLLGLLQRKKGFFEALLDLSELQQNLPLCDLFPLLEQKRVLLSCIESIDEELSRFQHSLQILSQEITEELEAIRLVSERLLHLDACNSEMRRRLCRVSPPSTTS